MKKNNSSIIVSGMRSTGALHLGHYHGVLKNWLKLQDEFECYFFIADWHALTTHYADKLDMRKCSIDMMIDFLSVGMDPNKATFFAQSQVKEHAELALLLSMVTPLSWLERVPSYKDLQQKLSERNLLNVGFLYYPLLQSSDVLIYGAEHVPVGEDQVAHIELAREVARRFNDTFGKTDDFEQKAKRIIKQFKAESASRFNQLREDYLKNGNQASLTAAKAIIDAHELGRTENQILSGYLENQGQMILKQPQAMLTETCKLPGLDGQKMSKSYHNTIFLREETAEVTLKIKKMQTDPARARRTDKGNPDHCPVFDFHKVYSGLEVQNWAREGCQNASIGCVECKSPLIDAVNSELTAFRNRRKNFQDEAQIVEILRQGAVKARDEASKTMKDVKAAIQLIE